MPTNCRGAGSASTHRMRCAPTTALS
jgi:hypothetical protein